MLRSLLVLTLFAASGCALETSVIGGGGGGDSGGGDASNDGGPDTGLDSSGPDSGECTPTSPSTEVCDGLDNDCDPSTVDGSGDPDIGTACDGSDLDMCAEGTIECIGGRAVCDDPTGNSREECNGADDDCDGVIDEGAQLQLYLDGDGDGAGRDDDVVLSCVAIAGRSETGGDCDDGDSAIYPGQDESCNWRDDDCDGNLDEEAGCTCTGIPHDGRLYAFCRGSQRWGDAGDRCIGLGMTLASLETAAEDAFVLAEVQARGLGQPWVGLHDQHDEMSWVWWDDSPVGFTNWADGEPNDGGGGIGREDCGVINHGGAANSWNDTDCWDDRNWVCEGPLP